MRTFDRGGAEEDRTPDLRIAKRANIRGSVLTICWISRRAPGCGAGRHLFHGQHAPQLGVGLVPRDRQGAVGIHGGEKLRLPRGDLTFQPLD